MKDIGGKRSVEYVLRTEHVGLPCLSGESFEEGEMLERSGVKDDLGTHALEGCKNRSPVANVSED
ncbi:unannotated protein [freshwater metagenome]|uniref:Unannotated protein n=1 Tax=freshwater metagenome TaxID=449393 RepID=A0A6J6RJG0_9ZZZZ